MRGLIHIYSGDGKGKTTASIGLSVRCAGSGGKVLFTQFLKNNQSSELKILREISNMELSLSEKTFGFYSKLSDKEKREAKDVYQQLLIKAIEKVDSGVYQMLVLDEVITAYHYQLIEQQYFVDFLKNKPEYLEVVLTGRYPADELIELADYVSEIKKIKHPYDQGIGARMGIEK